MYHSVTAIALRTIKHSDRSSILSLWTAELGRISVTVPADKGRRAARTRALTMPLSPLCLEVDVRPDRSIYNFRELRPALLIPGISTEPSKAITAMFLADFLEVCLRDHQPDPLMTAFLVDSIQLLDSLPREAALNFHIYFLLRLARFSASSPTGRSRAASSTCATAVSSHRRRFTTNSSTKRRPSPCARFHA